MALAPHSPQQETAYAEGSANRAEGVDIYCKDNTYRRCCVSHQQPAVCIRLLLVRDTTTADTPECRMYDLYHMEEWQLEFEWLRVRHWVKDRFNKKELPDLNAVLFLVGMQEVGKAKPKFSKEEKQDLMHVAICHLLSEEGYFEFEGMDADGWPHWKPLIPVDIKGVAAQETLLRRKVVEYFAPLLSNSEN